MDFNKLKEEIESEISDTKEIDGVHVPVKFCPLLSHDLIIKKQVEKCVLASELHKKPQKKIKSDNRFLSEKMRSIMYLPVPQKPHQK